MNNHDDMHRFVAALMRGGIVFAMLAALLLLGVAVLLVCKLGLSRRLRWTAAVVCAGAAVWIIAALLIGFFRVRRHKD